MSAKWKLALSTSVVVSFSALPLSSCGGDDSGSTRPSVQNLTKDFPNLNYTEEGVHIFRSHSALTRELKVRRPFDRVKLPNVDFSKRMVVVVAAGVRSSAGYRVRLIAVNREGAGLLIKVKENAPPKNTPSASVLTYPYVALAVPKTTGDIEADFVGR